MALDVGKKIGPLPMWTWMALAVLGLLIYNQWKSSTSNSSASTAQTPAQASLTAPPVTLIQEGFSGPPNNQSGSSGQPDSGNPGYPYVGFVQSDPTGIIYGKLPDGTLTFLTSPQWNSIKAQDPNAPQKVQHVQKVSNDTSFNGRIPYLIAPNGAVEAYSSRTYGSASWVPQTTWQAPPNSQYGNGSSQTFAGQY